MAVTARNVVFNLTCEVEGFDEVMAKLGRVEDMGGAFGQAINEGGHMMVDTAKALCPVDTGALRNSIGMSFSATKDTAQATVYAGMYYAPYVEFGTGAAAAAAYADAESKAAFDPGVRGHKPQPFMTPAYQQNAPGIYQRIMDAATRLRV